MEVTATSTWTVTRQDYGHNVQWCSWDADSGCRDPIAMCASSFGFKTASTCTCKTQSRDPKSKVLKTGDCPAARGTKGTMSEAEGLSKGIAGSSECLNLFGVGLGFEGLG